MRSRLAIRFLRRCLIEACLEAVQLDCVVGMQDLGAAGLASAAIEMASRSGMGLRLDVAKVPRRETGMTPYEVMLSESQERMLLAVRPGGESDIADLFSKWDLDSTVIGEFTDGKTVLINDGPVEATESPVHALTDAPEYVLSGKKPDWLDRVQNEDPAGLPLPDASPDEVLLQMLASPNIASKRAVFSSTTTRSRTHRYPTGRRCGPPEAKGHSQGDCRLRRLQRTPVLPGPIYRQHDCRRRSLQERVLHGRRPCCAHRRPQFRQPRNQRRSIPIDRVH